MNKTSDAKLRANKKWNSKNLDKITITVPKGQKALIQKKALENGMSMNALVNSAIERMLYEKKG